MFGLLDLRAALADFIAHEKTHGVDAVHVIGGPRRAAGNAELPFEHLQVWFKLRLQTREIHTNSILPAQTILASPPEDNWQYGRYDSVVVNFDGTKVWPTSGLEGLSLTKLYSHGLIHILLRTLSCTTPPHNAAYRQVS